MEECEKLSSAGREIRPSGKVELIGQRRKDFSIYVFRPFGLNVCLASFIVVYGLVDTGLTIRGLNVIHRSN